MSPVVRACKSSGAEFIILHTGQHYSYEMDQVFFDELELPPSDYNLEVGSGMHGEQTGKILQGIEKVLVKERPDAVLVEGDTNTVLAGALAAAKLGIKVGHVEAGLRSFDRSMPEELNRVLTDHISDWLFIPTEGARQHLLKEGITRGVVRTGNTIVDAVRQNLVLARHKSNVLHRLGLEEDNYLLATAHRQENVDDPVKLKNMLLGLRKVSDQLNMTLILPAHPRTRGRIAEFDVDCQGILVTDPFGYLDFLELEANARLVLTDSGGVQEEACILRVPCVTMRQNTERPETIEVGSNLLAGTDPQRILGQAKRMMLAKRRWRNPFGDGRAAQRIVRKAMASEK